jgi:SnoaL-like protein
MGGFSMLRPEEAYEGYERAWNEPGRADTLLEEIWAPDGVYADDEVPDGLVGPAALTAFIRESHEALPGFRVWATSTPRMLAGRMAITWAGEGGDPPIPQAGTDVIEFGSDGRITRVTDVLQLTADS